MTSNLRISLACGDYEIIRPLKEGTVRPDGIELTVLTKNDSATRHWRFLRSSDYDIAECSASSYILARDRNMPICALPIFLHRRFRHGFVFINTKAGISRPQDLIGRKVGVKSYQTTAVLWLRGILGEEYGVPHQSIEWFSELDEDVPFTPPAGVRLSVIPDSHSIETMLVEGQIDALLHPDIIEPILRKNPNVGRLFPNYKEEEVRYFAKTGIFPIMHVLAIRKDLVERHPWIVRNLYQTFDEAKGIAMQKMANPRLIPLAWYQDAWEEQERVIGPDPWEYGLTDSNRINLETLIRYSYQNGMITRSIPVEELFLPVSQGRKRGGFRT